MDILDNAAVAASDPGNPAGSQPNTDPQPDATPGDPAAPDADLTPEQMREQNATLQENLKRANGQISALQKKHIELVRGRMTSPNNQPNPPADGQEDPLQIVFTAKKMAGAELGNLLENEIFPLYDGSDPNVQEPALPAIEISKIRRNPWAFISDDTMRYTLQTGDLQPAKLEIDQAMADRAEELAARPAKPDPKIPKNLNPNPAPAGASPKDSEKSPWEMSMAELEQQAKAAASRVAAQ